MQGTPELIGDDGNKEKKSQYTHIATQKEYEV